MFSLILILFLFWFALSVLMAAGTLFLQGYFNESPPDLAELLWRAPAAAGGVSAFVLVWVIIAYNAPDRFAVAPTDFSSSEETKPVRSLTAVLEGKKVEYRLIPEARGQGTYRDDQGRPLPSRPEEIIVKEDGQDVVFKPERDDKGKFKVERGQPLRYRDDKGRYMEEGYLGRLSVPHPGRTFVYVLFNLAHAAVWFAVLWPVLRFSWGQSLLLTFGCWLVMTLLILPPILIRTRDVAQQRQHAAQQSANGKRGDRGGPPSFAIPSLRGRSRYLEATDAGKLMLTRVSSPARTVTFSVRVSGLPSRTTSAVSV